MAHTHTHTLAHTHTHTRTELGWEEIVAYFSAPAEKWNGQLTEWNGTDLNGQSGRNQEGQKYNGEAG